MKFNRKVSQATIDQVQLAPFEVLQGQYDNIYISFVAHPKETATEAWEENGDHFLWLVLLDGEISFESMKRALLKELDRFYWLDYGQIRAYVSEGLSKVHVH